MPAPPETRRGRPADTPDTLQTDRHRRDQVTDQGSALLGRQAVIVEDVDTTADVLAQMHGGPRRASAWLRSVLARLDDRGWS